MNYGSDKFEHTLLLENSGLDIRVARSSIGKSFLKKTSGFDIAAVVHLVQYALNITALKEYLNTVGQVRTVLDFFDGFVKNGAQRYIR